MKVDGGDVTTTELVRAVAFNVEEGAGAKRGGEDEDATGEDERECPLVGVGQD